MAGAVGCGVAGELDHVAVEFVSLAPAAQGGALREAVVLLGVGAQLGVHVVRGHHVARCDGVDGDAVGAPFDRECAGEAFEAGLGGAQPGQGIAGGADSAGGNAGIVIINYVAPACLL